MGGATSRIRMEIMVLETCTMESAKEKTQVESAETTAHSVIQKSQMMTDLMGLIWFHLRSLMKAGAGLLYLLHVLGQIAPSRSPQWKENQLPTRPVGKLCPLTHATPGLYEFGIQEWTLIDVIVDSGACETFMPKSLCEHIHITPSKQSIDGADYEVASGETIPNLGERICEVYAEGSESPLLFSRWRIFTSRCSV